jgi:hypothetical protein
LLAGPGLFDAHTVLMKRVSPGLHVEVDDVLDVEPDALFLSSWGRTE